ncbi:zinc finger MYM-type protein 1-like [Ylistrum balloti]|uniref:zinc finger MYM-type protein 1-like n=1 Tax=Ylistrum balloti TaxID=509963 RepID=UPI002905E2D0|nr:zinc finger MYM-type protein 1-like [Ylistrum balloti]
MSKKIEDFFKKVPKSDVEESSSNIAESLPDDKSDPVKLQQELKEGPCCVDLACEQLTDQIKKKVLLESWDQWLGFPFPQRKVHGRERRFNYTWLKEHPWMRYSVSKDSVYCVHCFIFGDKSGKERPFRSPVDDWINLSTYVKRHEAENSPHHGCQISADHFIDIMTGKDDSIVSKLDSSHKADVNKNRHILKKIIEVLLLCGRQNIAIRGHTEEKSNFWAILNVLCADDLVVQDHISNPNAQLKYTSPDIQNELIEILASHVTKAITLQIKESPYIAVLADECTDKSTKEQLSVCVRYLDTTENGEICVKEDFLCFIHVKSIKGEDLAPEIIQALRNFGLDIAKLRAQGYDGASNMSGKFRGVQAIIRQTAPHATYVHCKSHQLNLALVHSSSQACVRTIMGTVQDIAFAFDYSAKRLQYFKNELLGDQNAKDQMESRTKLRTLCETRWSSRADALHTFKASFSVIVSSLEALKNDGDDKAGGRLAAILRFEFIIGLVVTEHILSGTVALSNHLQSVDCDLMEAATECRTVISMLRNERADDDVWNKLFDQAVGVAAEYGIQPCVPRQTGRQQQRANYQIPDPRQYWKVSLFLVFLDHLITELETRLLDSEGRFKAETLFPRNLQQLTDDIVNAVFDAFEVDLSDKASYLTEVRRWRTRWVAIPLKDRPRGLCEILDRTSRDLYPNIRNIFSVLLSMPTSTASAERSFSSMRRIKTYLRTTMTTERLSALAVLNTHRDTRVDIDTVIDDFAAAKSRKLQFI